MFKLSALVFSALAISSSFALPQQPKAAGQFQGEGTYYYPKGGIGFCGSPLFDHQMIAALGEEFLNQVKCGQCLEVSSGTASVVVQIADKCAACKMGDVDLTPEAFKKIQGGSLTAGRIKITSKVVPCQQKKQKPRSLRR